MSLQRDLDQFRILVAQTMNLSTVEIRTIAESNPKVREHASAWNDLIITRIDQALANLDPLKALLDAWAVCEQALAYLGGKAAQDAFGAHAPLALASMTQVRDGIASIAATYLTSQDLDKAVGGIRVYVDENTIRAEPRRGRVSAVGSRLFSAAESGQKVLGSLISLSFLPGRAARGLAEAPGQLRDFNKAIDSFGAIVEGLPKETREQAEALLGEFVDSYTTFGLVLSDIQETANSLEAVLSQADSLTTGVGYLLRGIAAPAEAVTNTAEAVSEAGRAVQRATDSVESLIVLLRGARGTTSTMGHGDDTSFEAKTQRPNSWSDPGEYAETARAIQNGAQQVAGAADAIRLLLESTRAARATDDPQKRRFDVREYGEAAKAIQSAGQEIREVLREVERATSPGDTAAATSILVASLRSVVDHLFLRALQLAGVLLMLMVGYRVVAHRYWDRRRPGNTGR